jgi:hypothetical protein
MWHDKATRQPVVKKYADPSRITADLSVSRVSIALSLIAITAIPEVRYVVITGFPVYPFPFDGST